MDLFKKLDAVDKNTVRHVRQPLAELLRPGSYQGTDWSFRSGENALDATVPTPSDRGRELGELYSQFEQKVGRAPTYNERLDLQQDTTPFLAELAAGNALRLNPDNWAGEDGPKCVDAGFD